MRIIQWFESMDAVHEMRTDSRWAEVKADSAALLDMDKTLEIFTGEEQIVIAGPDERPDPLTKLVCGVRRKPGMAREDFHKYWWEVHGPLNRDTPAVRKFFIRYEQNHRLESDFARTDVDLEGVTCEWFPSTRDFFAMATDPDSRDVIRADEENFLDSDNLTWLLCDAEEVIFDRR